MNDAAFFSQLNLLDQSVRTDARTLAAPPAGDLTKEAALRMVLDDLAGALPEDYVRAAFDDPEAKIIPDIPGKFKPGKSGEEQTYDVYRKYFISPERVQKGVEFYLAHQALLASVESRTGVDAGILAALVGVETFYGTHTGTYPVFSALYTITRLVPNRSRWAGKELAEWLKICRSQNVPVHAGKGSYAGAFGYFQFMPSSYNRFAVDFDGDGRKKWDDWPDVLGSVGHYLAQAGWQPGGPLTKPAKNYYAIFAYNHSDNYVRVIVDLRAEILKRLPAPRGV